MVAGYQQGVRLSPTPRADGCRGLAVQAVSCIQSHPMPTSRHGTTRLLIPRAANSERSTFLSEVRQTYLCTSITLLTCLLGTAIHAYFIVPDDYADFEPGVTLLTNMSVVIDNEHVGSVLHVPQNQSAFIYNFLGYSNTGLSDDTHVMTISANNQVASSTILFDYIIYTCVTLMDLARPNLLTSR